ncbi:14609_t:CDS:2 [Acaulospora colombiana]|uniref:14609_t:CDS:1 n=1 Tax=Acaulospora colombiana TaxID=27376 RepID=A0ACA9NBS6_9GLOM|nr:14609_t:CDS:2 [Acaulospora colombiana]
MALPASETKHIPILSYQFGSETFTLNQRDDHGVTNGTTLWLGGQVLAYYLSSELPGGGTSRLSKGGTITSDMKLQEAVEEAVASDRAPKQRRKRAIELGSGIGLTALALHSMGWDVCATDVEPVVSTVLRPNIKMNTGDPVRECKKDGHILECRELDWAVPPQQWDWAHPEAVARHQAEQDTFPTADSQNIDSSLTVKRALSPPFDLIVTADTLYTPALVIPLLRSLHNLASLSIVGDSKHSCTIYVAVERRDPGLMDRAFQQCSSPPWGFRIERVRATKVRKALEKAKVPWVKERGAWEGVEIWKMRLPRDMATAPLASASSSSSH